MASASTSASTQSGAEHIPELSDPRSPPHPSHGPLPLQCIGRPHSSCLSQIHAIAPPSEILIYIIAWIILGLIAGFIASKIVNRTGEGLVVDILLGICGAVIGGWLFPSFGMRGVSGVNLYSFLVATIGAVLLLVVYHALFHVSRFRRV